MGCGRRIRSALPDGSISATSFISSIGNGEAIAFGEAIAVPMRMRFSRVEQRYLRKASGTVVRPSDELPDNIDLRDVISRMRASAEPDMGGFSPNYAPATPTSHEEAPIEPYRPDMLPNLEPESHSTSPGFKPASAYAGLRNADAPGLFATATSPVVPPRREHGMSLRESILKKPLGGGKE